MILSVSFSLAALIIQVLVPGWIVMRGLTNECTFSDSFILGFLIVCVTSLSAMLFVEDLEAISLVLRISILLLAGSLVVLSLARKKIQSGPSWRSQFGVIRVQAGITVAVLMLLAAFVFSHNLGFDDIAHLEYLSRVKGENLYPVFIPVTEEYEVARYPLFGVTLGLLSHGVRGGEFFIYYFFGASLMICFFCKVARVVWNRDECGKSVAGVCLIVLCIFLVGGPDNYFNFGLYPLQQAKLIFLLGTVYLIEFAERQDGWWRCVLGSSLLTISVGYHFNLVLLSPIIVGAVGYVLFRNWRKSGFTLVIGLVLVIPFLSTLAALRPETGFVRVVPPDVVIETSVTADSESEQALLPKLVEAVTKLLSWVRDGRYKDFYKYRVYSLEIALIPSVLLLSAVFSFWAAAYPAALATFIALAIVQGGATIPRQYSAAFLTSGPWIMLSDLAQSELSFDETRGSVLLTDRYSALILSSLGYRGVVGLSSTEGSQILSPISQKVERHIREKLERISETEGSAILINSRYWGRRVLEGIYQNDSTEYPNLDSTLKRIFWHGQKRDVKTLITDGRRLLEELLNAPIAIVPLDDFMRVERNTESESAPLTFDFYRDSALVRVGELDKDQALVLEVEGVGDFLELRYSDNKDPELRALNDSDLSAMVDHSEKTVRLRGGRKIDGLTLFMTLDKGHLNGLGSISNVVIRE